MTTRILAKLRVSLTGPLFALAFIITANAMLAVRAAAGGGDPSQMDLLLENTVTGQRVLWQMGGPNNQYVTLGLDMGYLDPAWAIVGRADFDGDGVTDTLLENKVSGQRELWLMGGPNNQYVTLGLDMGYLDPAWHIVGTADFNWDGHPDILLENTVTGQRVLWIMGGQDSQFVTLGIDLGFLDPAWHIVGLADFNWDNHPDILLENAVTGQRVLWLMGGPNSQYVTLGLDLGVLDPAWHITSLADFDGDDHPDILLENTTSGQRVLWIMGGPNGQYVTLGLDLGVLDPTWHIVGSTKRNGIPAVAINDTESSRFLIQASFGPSAASIAHLRSMTYASWLDEQLALSPTYHLPYYYTRAAEFLARAEGDGYFSPRQEAWWQFALTAPDQLRQRMAFALSEILVISQDSSLNGENEGVAAYYDILVRHAFGNYRQLLEEVTLSPMMGTYLSMIRNRKPNTKTGRQPDENYAREIMQLFSIGLSELNLDGSLRLGPDGQSIPTYTQADIVGLAHVFTGWGPHFDASNPPKWDDGTVAKANDWFLYGWDPLQPMSFNSNYGDLQNRQIVGSVVVPGSSTGPLRLKLALDTLFNHPNVGPFLGRQLIQRFVTSNPSPEYIRRVASVFNDNGAGVRGDLGATLRAVLLDPEARRTDSLADPKFGKLVEPLLRMTRLFRAFPLVTPPYAASGDNRVFLNFVYNMDEQSPLFSPTVFNFFKPGFAKAGPIAVAGLVSPEFQIYDDVTAILEANRNYSFIYSGIYIGEPESTGTSLKLDLTEPLGILTTVGLTHPAGQAALVDFFNQRLLGGHMSPFLRQKILDTYASLPTSFSYTAANERRRVQLGLYLVIFSPEFNIQH